MKKFQQFLNEMSARSEDLLMKEFTKMGSTMKKNYIAEVKKKMWDELDEIGKKLAKGETKSQEFYREYSRGYKYKFKQLVSRSYESAEGSHSTQSIIKLKDKKDLIPIVEKESQFMADTFYDSFIKKNTDKLRGIIKEKEIKKFDFKFHNNLDGIGRIEFTDGSGFTVTFTTIWKVSSRGNWFNQWPTRFTNITLSDGTKMKSPSEAKMKKEFK